MLKIFLARHGQDTDNESSILNGRRDTKLTELGRKQASEAADKLIDKDIEIVYSSPLKRAYETASIIAKRIGVNDVVEIDDLVERDFGVLTGKSISEITHYANNILKTDKVNYFLDAEGAEDFPTLLEREKKLLNKIFEKHKEGNILLVTHGDTGKMLQAAFYGWDWEKGLKEPYFANTEILELSK